MRIFARAKGLPFARILGRIFWLGCLFVLIGGMVMLRWGGYLLVVSDPLPQHAQVVVVLAGSRKGEAARRAEAIRLLREGRADRVALSVPNITYLGVWVPDLMRRYIAQEYGENEAERVVLCPQDADSTWEEADALRDCLKKHGWRSVVVVTSNFHTRRARLIWRKVFEDEEPPLIISVHGVSDGDFQVEAWWRKRRYAKTFLQETTKLAWTCLFE